MYSGAAAVKCGREIFNGRFIVNITPTTANNGCRHYMPEPISVHGRATLFTGWRRQTACVRSVNYWWLNEVQINEFSIISKRRACFIIIASSHRSMCRSVQRDNLCNANCRLAQTVSNYSTRLGPFRTIHIGSISTQGFRSWRSSYGKNWSMQQGNDQATTNSIPLKCAFWASPEVEYAYFNFFFSNPTLHRRLAPLRTGFTDILTALRLLPRFNFFL